MQTLHVYIDQQKREVEYGRRWNWQQYFPLIIFPPYIKPYILFPKACQSNSLLSDIDVRVGVKDT